MIRSPFTDLLNIEHPIALAPMAGVAGGSLAEAVSVAGGFGIVGGGYGDERWLRNELASIDCTKIGVGFITWRLQQQPELLSLALEHKPKAIFLSFGDISSLARIVATSNTLLIAQVQSLEDARIAVDAGADVIVAQGSEAGGHGSQRATLPLVPAIVDAIDNIPVIAAGGIADGRGLAAALMLGATGVVMGTRFYCSSESLAPANAQSRALAASGDDTTRSSVFDVLRQYDWPAPYNIRTIKNHMTALYADRLGDLDANKHDEIRRFEQALNDGDFSVAAVIAGEALDLVNDVPSAAQIIDRTMAQALKVIRQPANFSFSR